MEVPTNYLLALSGVLFVSVFTLAGSHSKTHAEGELESPRGLVVVGPYWPSEVLPELPVDALDWRLGKRIEGFKVRVIRRGPDRRVDPPGCLTVEDIPEV